MPPLNMCNTPPMSLPCAPGRLPPLSVCSTMLGPMSVDQMCETARRADLDGVELLGEPGQYDIESLVATLGRYELKVTGLTAAARLSTGRDLSHPDSARRERGIAHLRACIALAQHLDAPVVAVAPAAVGRYWLEATRPEEWAWCIASLRELAYAAQEAGVTLALELLNRYAAPIVRDVEVALELIDEVDSGSVGLVLDIFHAAIEEPSIAGAVRLAGDRLVNVQVADSNRLGPGHGSVDFGALTTALVDIAYCGPLSLEAFPPGCGAFPDVRTGELPIVKSMLNEFRPFFSGLEAFSLGEHLTE